MDNIDYKAKFDQLRLENNALRNQARSVPELEKKIESLHKRLHGLEYGSLFDLAHPGEILSDMILVAAEKAEKSDTALRDKVRALEIDDATFAALLEGNRVIDVPIALKLGICFGNGARFWLMLQHQYNMSKLRQETEPSSDEIMMQAFCAAIPSDAPAT